MKTPVSKNDATLAHGLATRELRAHHEKLSTRVARLSSVHKGSTALRKMREAFAGYIVAEFIVKPSSRWMLVLVEVSKGDICFSAVVWHRDYLIPRTLAIIDHHAVARMFQRTIGHGDLTAVIARLKPFARVMLDVSLKRRDEGSVRLALVGNGGALLGEIESGVSRFATWVDSQTAADPFIRECGSDVDTIHVRIQT